ncbi:MAG: GNAT family N-acetyltransferase [Snowella sp.]|nr:GNAT family N-acetyltransferase [Snowella sp.]
MFKSLKSQYTVTWQQRMADIPQAAWDALAQPLKTPFLEWEWLHNLEASGSATAKTGWQPCHLTVWKGQTLVAAAPLYLKGHSYGEFVFDHQWSNLAYRLGIEYYPKLLGMTPFTPAEGYQFLIAPDEDEFTLTEMMVSAIDHFCDRNRLSSCNFLFVNPEWRQRMENYGFTPWLHHSYIWTNREFASFDDYLKMFNANQRRNIKRERKAVDQAGLTIKTLAGEDIPHHLFPLIYRFYSSTCDKFYWGSKYLTRKFFENLYPNYRDRVVLVTAFNENNSEHPVGLSFCLRKGENLYGRYWGSFQEYDCLHFEACYYQPIEWAISQGIKLFDPGAGGQHKRRRGFPATPNYSLHRFYNQKMSQILLHYIGEINQLEQEEIDAINQDLPFNKREINLQF